MKTGALRIILGLALGAAAPTLAAPTLAAPVVQSEAQAWAQDGAEYARRFGVSDDEGARRLRALNASAPFTAGLRATFADRWVGAVIEHQPGLRIVVLLAGPTPVSATRIEVEGVTIPVEFRTGAPFPAATVLRALIERQPALDKMFPNGRGRGLDPRTGDLVILLTATDAARGDLGEWRARAEALTGVKIRFDRADGVVANQAQEVPPPLPDRAVIGGGRIVGRDPGDGKNYACTTGFAVSDGSRSGVATAAHCPDTVAYQGRNGSIPLDFAGQYGVSTQDVQIHPAPDAQPFFYADRKAEIQRRVAGERSRMSTRGGEFLCRQGTSSGYSCAEVTMTHFAPPTPLCAGPCSPSWVMLRTQICRSGDSGGPVFSGPIAFGIHKGGSAGDKGGRCNFTFYMSTDFLPAGWRVMR